MVATDIREQRLRIQLWPAAGGDLGIGAWDEALPEGSRRGGRPGPGRGDPRACASFGRACAMRRACGTNG